MCVSGGSRDATRSPSSSGFPGGVRFEYHGDPEDLAGFSDFFRTFFAGGAASGGGARMSGTSGSRVRTGRATTIEDLLGGLGFGGLDASELDETGRFGAGFGPARSLMMMAVLRPSIAYVIIVTAALSHIDLASSGALNCMNSN